MSGKNGRIILGGLIAAGVVAIAAAAAALGLGSFAFLGGQPGAPASPAPTLAPSPAPAGNDTAQSPFYYIIESNKASRTYRINLEQAPGAAPVDMSRVKVKALADGVAYDAWSFDTGGYVWIGNYDGDSVLDGREIFSMTVDIGQARVPMGAASRLQLVVLADGAKALELNMTPV